MVKGVISRLEIRTGLSVAMLSIVLSGNRSTCLQILIFCTPAIYYCVFEGSVIAVAIQAYFPSLSIETASLIVVLYSVPLVFGSVQNWLDKFNGILLPFYILGLIAAVAVSINEFGYSNAWLNMGPEGGNPENGWWNCFTYFMGVWILMMYTWDYARFGQEKDADYHAKINFGMPFYLFTFMVNGVVGIFLAATIPTEGGLTEVSVVLAILKLMGIWGLLFVWVSQTRINTANFYLAAENMQAFFEKFGLANVPRFAWAIVVGAVVYALMLMDVFSFILQALAYQGIFVVAWVAIALAHIFSPKYDQMFDGHIECDRNKVTSFNPCGLISWFSGAGVGIIVLNFGNESLSLFSAPLTFLISFCVYLMLLNSAKHHWFVKEPKAQ